MRFRVIVPALLAIAVGVYLWKTAPADSNVPACTWRIGLGTDIQQGRNFETVASETPIRLSVVCREPRHVYVFSHSDEDGTVLLFPSPDIDSDASNPLPPGRTVLPGRREDADVAWTTRHAIRAVTTYFALAASEPIPEIEELLPRLRRWTNTTFPDHSMAVTQPSGEVELLGKPQEAIPSRLLRLAADIGDPEPNPNGPMRPATGYPGVFTSSWKVRERKPGSKPDGEGKNK